MSNENLIILYSLCTFIFQKEIVISMKAGNYTPNFNYTEGSGGSPISECESRYCKIKSLGMQVSVVAQDHITCFCFIRATEKKVQLA